MSALNPDDPRPAFQQVASHLRAAIDAGDMAPGDQLPTHRELANKYGVAIETVKRALGELRTENMIVTRHGKGSYVRHGAPGDDQHVDAMSVAISELRRDLQIVQRRVDALERRDSGT